MATSGTYNFNPTLGEILLVAFGRCGIRRTALLQEHIEDARLEANFLFSEWANRGINLWKVDKQSISLTQGIATYYADSSNTAIEAAKTIMVLDAYVTIGTGQSQFDRVIMPISRTEYAQVPNKNLQAPPTSFWFDRLIEPTITLWPVPDQSNQYTLTFYRVIQIQDANTGNANTVDVPYRWLDAVCSGLAARLAAIYSPERYQILSARAEQSYQIAATQDTENVSLYITPSLSGYYRT